MVELNLTHKRKSFNDNGVQFAWDSTSISLAQTCPRKYQYRMIEGWRKSDESVHLRFGKHFATALEHYYKHVALGMEWEDALDEVVLEALSDTWDHADCETCRGKGTVDERLGGEATSSSETPCPDCGGTGRVKDGAPWQSFDSVKTRETLIRSIVWYVDQFHDEPIKVMTLADGRPAVEYSFALPVDDGIILTGHIDRVVEYADNPYVMDQKTTKQTISPYWFNQFKPYTQFSMYTFAGKMIFGIPVKGVIIDGGQINVGFTRFERSVSMRTEGELTEWYEDAMRWIETTQKMTVENHFPMNPASCGNYGGCEFRGVCSRDPALRENFLKADFNKNEPWDPLEAR